MAISVIQTTLVFTIVQMIQTVRTVPKMDALNANLFTIWIQSSRNVKNAQTEFLTVKLVAPALYAIVVNLMCICYKITNALVI